MSGRSMIDAVSRSERVCALRSVLSTSAGESSGPNARPMSAFHDSRAALRPRSVAMLTRNGT